MLAIKVPRALALGACLASLVGCNLIFRYRSARDSGSASDAAHDGRGSDGRGDGPRREGGTGGDAGECPPAICTSPNECQGGECAVCVLGVSSGTCPCPSGVLCGCDVARGCLPGTVECTGDDCRVACHDQSCSGAAIACGAGPCDITCGPNACSGARIDCSPSTACNLQCSETQSCSALSVTCGKGPCTITCGPTGCGGAKVSCGTGGCCTCGSTSPLCSSAASSCPLGPGSIYHVCSCP